MQKRIKSTLLLIATSGLLSIAFITTKLSALESKQIEQAQKSKEIPASFKTPAWIDNAEILNIAMELNPKGLDGIYAMYKSRFQATKSLENEQLRTVDIKEVTIPEKLKGLIDPVKVFLPQVKEYKALIVPLITLSLNRSYNQEETNKFPTYAATPLSFETSVFKRFLDSKEDINIFMAKTITTETEYLALCKEFQRVFSDLLEYALPNLTKKFIDAMAKQQQAPVAKNAQVVSAPAA